MRYTFQGARLVDAEMDVANGDLTIDGGHLHSTATDAPATDGVGPGQIIDAAGMIVVPGFIDVHTHGGGGCNLHTVLIEEILTYARWAPSTGVTSFLIGVVGTSGALPEDQLRTAARAVEIWRQGAEPLGIHLEGPFINARRRGAHLPSWLRLPNPVETERVLELANGHLSLITLAPELPGATALLRRMVEAGVTVSIGHTDASYEQALAAIALGATHMTHCCNAMRPLHHRDSGPLGALAQAPQVFGEVIADGVHVHPAMMQILLRVLGPQRAVIVTDALAAAGVDETSFDFAGQAARVEHGAARLADGTITGSILTMDAALRNVMHMTDVTLSAAIGMMTLNPARTIHTDHRKGRLRDGYDADLAILDDQLTLQATICCGEVVYATPAWRARFTPELASPVRLTSAAGEEEKV